MDGSPSAQGASRQVIALAAVGCMGRYVCEELLKDDRFDVVVISRSKGEWFTNRNIPLHESDYSLRSVLAILDKTRATTLISFLNVNDDRYISIHTAFIGACLASETCKRLMPSEYCGNIEEFPDRPRFYGTTREPIRKVLRGMQGLEWTLLECGWFMDYFLKAEKSHMRPVPDEFPIDLDKWTARIRGTGDELQSWTIGREVGKAAVELCAAKKWDPVTYVVGQWGTFNEAVKIMEDFYGRPIEKTYTPEEEIRAYVEANLDSMQEYAVQAVMCDEFSIDGATACPKEKTLEQREKFFKDLHFSSIKEVLQKAEEVDFL
ncbi:MAG: hypothetical protein L6R37_007813 [Teloschistes peruensis]|nr:MAG: hypothetical protein L6R37_007813 [Teloschistes peruensis]